MSDLPFQRSNTLLFTASVMFLLCATAVQAEPPLNILFIGNSFTNVGPIPTAVADIAQDAGWARPNCVNASVNSMSLEWHTTNPATLAYIDQGGWDYVVLQELSTRPTDSTNPDAGANPARFKADVVWLYDRIKASSPNAIIVLYQTWARHENYWCYPSWYANRDEMQAQVNYHYHDAAENYLPAHATYAVKNDVLLAPCGEVWGADYHGRNLKFHGDDNYHQGLRGIYVNGLVIYSTIYDRKVSNLTYRYCDPLEAIYMQQISDQVTGKTLVGNETGEFQGPRLLGEATYLGNGLTGYTFSLSNNDGLLTSYRLMLKFSGVGNTTIRQTKAFSVVAVDSETMATTMDGQGVPPYQKSLDSWAYAPFGNNPAQAINLWTGQLTNGFEESPNSYTLSVSSGTGSALGDGVPVAYIVANGPVSWEGMIYRGASNRITAGRVSLPGDYNLDGFVDLADYTVWADNYNRQGELPADGNGDGVVDLADYTIWADHYGSGTQP